MAPSRAQPTRNLRARPSNGSGHHGGDNTTTITTVNTPTYKKNTSILNGSSKGKSTPISTPQTTRVKRRFSEISKTNNGTPVNVSTKKRQSAVSNGTTTAHRSKEQSSPRQKRPQNRPQTIDDIRQDALIGKKRQLEDVLQQQDARVRQLFHLHKFVTLTSYDPEVARQDDSHVFEEFRQAFDLWEAVARDKTGGNSRSTRRQVNQQKLLLEELDRRTKQLPPTITSDDSSNDSESSVDSASETTESSDEQSDDDIVIPPLPSDRPLPKSIKLKFSIPSLIVSHPSHVLPPTDTLKGSLDKYLSSFAYYGDSEDMSIEEYQRKIDEEARLRKRINEATKSGRIFQDAAGNLSGMSKAFVPPRKEPAHFDHLVAHAIQFSRLISDERRSHVSKSKRIAMMIQQHFRRLSTAGEKEKKMEIRRIRQLAKRTALEVKKKWRIAEKVVIQRQQAIKQEQRRRAGKLQLEQILEHSSMLLEARLQSRSATPTGKVEELEESDSPMSPSSNMSSKTSASAITDITGISEEESLNLNMDSDSDGTSADELKEDDVDQNLSIDALKAKYSNIESNDLDQTPKEEKEVGSQDHNNSHDTSDSDVTMDSENEEESNLDSDNDEEEKSESGLLALFSNGAPNKTELNDETLKSPVKTNGIKQDTTSGVEIRSISPQQKAVNGTNGNLESDDESVLMDSEEEEEEEYGSDSDSASQEAGPTLADLFSSKEDIDDSANDHLKDDDPSAKLEEDDNKVFEPESSLSKDNEVSPKVQIPFLLHGQLREYQRQGLEWLVGLYNNNTNGILADEMGLGKTIQTISLIAYLACYKSIWGPHLIIVPTSVMLNWEMEFKRFAPGLKILTYYGNPAQRKEKRRGWNKEDTWHVCITSYQLVLHDHVAFRRKHWHFMILDEAHNIKNFRSQRWQALLNFRADHRLLLTGTPLQNNLVELWSLLYFLMPSSRNSEQMPEFANLKNFQEWFSRPVDKIMEGEEMDNEAKVTVSKLHTVLRPYLLRRLKADVEKQMPGKYEHVVYCRLSKRQRFLYDDFMSRAQTKETLASGNFLSIINCLMQLRKVCNHPDLFEVRPIVTSFAMERSVTSNFGKTELLVRKSLASDLDHEVNLDLLNLLPAKDSHLSTITTSDVLRLRDQISVEDEIRSLSNEIDWDMKPDNITIDGHTAYRRNLSKIGVLSKKRHLAYLNNFRCSKVPLYSRDLLQACRVPDRLSNNDGKRTPLIKELNPSLPQQASAMDEIIDRFGFVTPAVKALDMPRLSLGLDEEQEQILRETYGSNDPLGKAEAKLSIAFPDKRLLQYDCGKLQRLAGLLRDLISQGHRALIFTQMTRVLDILEQFINIHGWRYLRLDGSTKIEQRQLLTERFNTDPKIPLFILSTRSGGLGINLTGADTVIFYDSDWNPSMDRQCQDRCHRIGQTRDVHIYRLVSEHTIESNILRKASQKTLLDNIVIQEGDFTTDYLSKLSLRDMLGDDATVAGITGADDKPLKDKSSGGNLEKALLQAEDADDAAAASSAMKEVAVDDEDFGEANADTKTRESSTGRDHDMSNNASGTNTPLTPPSRQSEGPAVSEGLEEVRRNDVEDNDVEMVNDEDDGIGDVDDYMITFIERGYYY